MLPQKIFETVCSEIASEAILGRNPSRSNYMAQGVLYPLFGQDKVLRLAEQQLGWHH